MLEQRLIKAYGDDLYTSLRDRVPVEPLTVREPEITIEDAYHISLRLLDRRLADGEKVIGKKIGLTSKVVQKMLGVNQPDFGYLTDAMLFNSGDEVPVSSQMIQPKAEGEIAFVLKDNLEGPGISSADVLRATEGVMACFEIVDSRVKDWKIKIQDTVADNASCGVIVLGENLVDPRKVDLVTCGMVIETNGEVVATGAGAAALNSPVNCVAWLANQLSQFEIGLKAGEVILSGSLAAMVPVRVGDNMRVRIGGIGEASLRYV
jgi:2-oxopent-4-enoate/cis-2-oxohex-4-enoate hydratase